MDMHTKEPLSYTDRKGLLGCGGISSFAAKLSEPAVERVGRTRISQSTNGLIMKSTMGHVRTPSYVLPSDFADHTYGQLLPKDPEGAGAVALKWTSQNRDKSMQPGRDFIAMNKISSNTSQRNIRQFRSQNEKQLKFKVSAAGRTSQAFAEGATFGRVSSNQPLECTKWTGPATSAKDVIESKFEKDFINMKLQDISGKASARKYFPRNPTKSSLGHEFGATQRLNGFGEKPQKEKFKLSKFLKVQSRIMLEGQDESSIPKFKPKVMREY